MKIILYCLENPVLESAILCTDMKLKRSEKKINRDREIRERESFRGGGRGRDRGRERVISRAVQVMSKPFDRFDDMFRVSIQLPPPGPRNVRVEGRLLDVACYRP